MGAFVWSDSEETKRDFLPRKSPAPRAAKLSQRLLKNTLQRTDDVLNCTKVASHPTTRLRDSTGVSKHF